MFNLFQAGIPGVRKIDEKVGTGSSGVLEFSSIPATYRSLLIMLAGRSSVAATSTTVTATFETSPTAGAYNWQSSYASGGTPGATEGISQSGIYVGSVAGASAPTDSPGGWEIWILEYTNTSLFKTMLSRGIVATAFSAGNIFVEANGGIYESTAAIDRIRLTLTSGNWTTTSRATLYGLRG